MCVRALQAEQRLARVSGEAAEAQAAAAAAKSAGRELKEKAAAVAREAGLRRDEVSRLKGEAERSRTACAEKVLVAMCQQNRKDRAAYDTTTAANSSSKPRRLAERKASPVTPPLPPRAHTVLCAFVSGILCI